MNHHSDEKPVGGDFGAGVNADEKPAGGNFAAGVKANSGGPGPRIMAASTLEGTEVVNSLGETLGTIEEIMIDVPSGCVAYSVLASGGLLGIGEKLFAIPWRALRLDTARECFVLDVDMERFKAAPGFDKNNWPTMADPVWVREVSAYYGKNSD